MDRRKIQAEGQLERAGSTRHQHGSHVLVPTGDRIIRFILRSETLQLREYEGQRVRISASLVEGYPPNEEVKLLDKGEPKLLDVFSIASLQQEEGKQ
jgi:hypothetical protein